MHNSILTQVAQRADHADPAWLDRQIYPFQSRWFELPAGRMHYLDEGRGVPIVMVHGTPSWSFLYRHLVEGLRGQYRCITADNIGFGLSDKPADWAYGPAGHAANLAALLDHLGLDEFVLMVHDLGGPVGLPLAIEQPERIRALVLFNTMMWPMEGAFAIPPAGKLMNSAIGRWLYLQQNISPRMLLPMTYGDRRKLTPAIHRHYTAPFSTPAERHGAWGWVQALVGAGDWYESLWQRRERIADLPA
ncbi:MAG TPA: alpha/beta fold hydrolase, partial [Roseiflexaceae bacterium]|nr:alpha/beta fold hydrolase [Roseiflexaceae bacterium]